MLASRKSSVAAESLENYGYLIMTAKADLEAHLESIYKKLELIAGQTLPDSDSDALELQQIKEKWLSMIICFQVCVKFSECISQIQLTYKCSGSSTGLDLDTEAITNDGLQDCKNCLHLTISKLEGCMQDIMDQMVAKSKTAITSEVQILLGCGKSGKQLTSAWISALD